MEACPLLSILCLLWTQPRAERKPIALPRLTMMEEVRLSHPQLGWLNGKLKGNIMK